MLMDLRPLRYFGCCPEKGCGSVLVVEEGSNRHLVREGDTPARLGVLLVIDGSGQGWPLDDYGPQWRAVMQNAGFTCPKHGETLIFKRGRFTYDPDKICDGRCMNATGPSCSCSCKGKNHGGKFL